MIRSTNPIHSGQSAPLQLEKKSTSDLVLDRGVGLYSGYIHLRNKTRPTGKDLSQLTKL
jgi:hypothetical protein